MAFTNQLKSTLSAHANAALAKPMAAYMKQLFPFLGIKAPERKALLKTIINTHKDELKANCKAIAEQLYQLPEREYHYCAIEIVDRFLKPQYQEGDIPFIRFLICTHSHWDTVDVIAKHILGNYILQFWDKRVAILDALSHSDNLWLQRSAILFQLGYKGKTDAELLFKYCAQHKDSDEFFIQKAIGWALREYGKTNPKAVLQFVNTTELKPLSQREAFRRLK